MNIDDIIQRWRESSTELNAGASQQALAELEARLSFRFPDSFKNLYRVTNGYPKLGVGHSLWSLQDILTIYEQDANKEFIAFADILLNSHWIGFCRDQVGIFKEYDLDHPIALTFEEGLELIFTDHDLVY